MYGAGVDKKDEDDAMNLIKKDTKNWSKGNSLNYWMGCKPSTRRLL